MESQEIFSFEFIKAAQKEINGLDAEKVFEGYEIEFPSGMGKVPVLEMCSVFEKEPSFEDKVRITRHCLLNKQVTIKLNGSTLDTILMNDFNVDFDVFKVFSDHPFALMFIIQTCFVSKLKNSMPPSKNTSEAKVD